MSSKNTGEMNNTYQDSIHIVCSLHRKSLELVIGWMNRREMNNSNKFEDSIPILQCLLYAISMLCWEAKFC